LASTLDAGGIDEKVRAAAIVVAPDAWVRSRCAFSIGYPQTLTGH